MSSFEIKQGTFSIKWNINDWKNAFNKKSDNREIYFLAKIMYYHGKIMGLLREHDFREQFIIG